MEEMDIIYHDKQGFLEVKPTGKLEESDFDRISDEIEKILKTERELKGVLIYTKDFPGYERFSDLIAHARFVKEHHDKVNKLAFCTDSNIGTLLKSLAKRFAEARVKRFDYDQRDEAVNWLIAED
jgi:hypothetical protein